MSNTDLYSCEERLASADYMVYDVFSPTHMLLGTWMKPRDEWHFDVILPMYSYVDVQYITKTGVTVQRHNGMPSLLCDKVVENERPDW